MQDLGPKRHGQTAQGHMGFRKAGLLMSSCVLRLDQCPARSHTHVSR